MRKRENNRYPALKESNRNMEILRKGYPIDGVEQSERLENDMQGVYRTMNIIREIARKGVTALSTAAFVLATLERMQSGSPVIRVLLAELNCGQSPAAYMSEVCMMVSRLDPYKLDRIETAITNCHELFDVESIDQPLDEFIAEFEE